MTRAVLIALALLAAAPANADQAGAAYGDWYMRKFCAEHQGDSRCKPVRVDTRPIVWVPR